jgi:hypothetical protein
MTRTAAALTVLFCLGHARAQETETYVLRRTVSNRETIVYTRAPEPAVLGRTGSRPFDPLAGLPGPGDLRLASATRQAIEKVTGPAAALEPLWYRRPT